MSLGDVGGRSPVTVDGLMTVLQTHRGRLRGRRGGKVAGMALLSEDATPVGLERTAVDAPGGAPPLDLRLKLLNGFELTSGTRPVGLGLASQRLLALLALMNRPLLRGFVAFSLWPNKTEERAIGSLRTAVWKVRQARLGLIECSGPRLALRRELSVDFHVAVVLAHRVIAGDHPVDHRALSCLLTAGDLLLEWHEPWIEPERERLRQLRLHALEALSAQFLDQGDFPAAIEVGVAAVVSEPRRESSRRILIRAHLAEGNGAEALRQYEAYRYVVRSELGITPSPQMEALMAPIRNSSTGNPSRTGHTRAAGFAQLQTVKPGGSSS